MESGMQKAAKPLDIINTIQYNTIQYSFNASQSGRYEPTTSNIKYMTMKPWNHEIMKP